jgi:hypothetical protein
MKKAIDAKAIFILILAVYLICEETCCSHTAPLFVPEYFRLSFLISFPQAGIETGNERVFNGKS